MRSVVAARAVCVACALVVSLAVVPSSAEASWAYELVTPAGSDVNVGGNDEPRAEPSITADGNSVAFISLLPLAGATSGGSTGWRSTRTPTGWEPVSLLTPAGTNQWAGMLGALDTMLRAATPGGETVVYYDNTTEPHASLWVRRADGSRVRIADSTVTTATGSVEPLIGALPGQPWAQAISEDGRHVVFTSTVALVPGLTPTGNEILYEWVDDGARGTVRVVNLRNGAELELIDPGPARLGGTGPHNRAVTWEYGRRNAISADGERIIFQNPAPADDPPQGGGPIYVREHGERTIEVSAPAAGHSPGALPTRYQYLDASDDGKTIYFWASADGDLTPDAAGALRADPDATGAIYRFDLDEPALTLVATVAPNLNGLPTALASADGRYLYFEDATSLLVFDGRTTSTVIDSNPLGAARTLGGVSARPGLRSSECPSATVTPDGRYLAFTARNAINIGDVRVYRYDAVQGSLDEISASPFAPAAYHAGFLSAGACRESRAGPPRLLEARVMSDDGQRIFFDTAAPLLPGDSNNLVDTYKWEAGRLSLVTTGTGNADVAFYGTDSRGETVVFATTEQLDPADTDSFFDIYAARLGGGFPVREPPVACSGDSCQGTVAKPPVKPNAQTTVFRSVGSKSARGPRLTVGPLTRGHRRQLLRRGSVTLRIATSQATLVIGRLDARLSGRWVRSDTGQVRTGEPARTKMLTLRLSRRAKQRLARTGRLRVRVTVRIRGTQEIKRATLVLRRSSTAVTTSEGR